MNIGLAAAMNKLRKTYLEEEDTGRKWPFFHTHTSPKMLLFKERQRIIVIDRGTVVSFQCVCVDTGHISRRRQAKEKKIPGCFDNLVITRKVINLLNVCSLLKKHTQTHTL